MIANQANPIPDTAHAQRHPTSFAQRRMWFLHSFAPASPLYNIPCAFRRQAPLDLWVFRRALHEIVRRHESLRTTFALEDGEPVQVVAPERTQAVNVVDLRRLPPAQRYLEAQRLAFEEARLPFDLERGPLLRVTVLVLDEADRLLLFTLHHIIADGGSIQQFFRELEALEAAFSAGQPSPLEPLPAQYSTYARWQKERMRGSVLDAHLSYWRGKLGGAPPVIELPLDRPRPRMQRFAGATLPLLFEPALLDGLRKLARRNDSTLFMVLLAGFCALLHRYTGQTDIVVGTPIALRQKPEFEPLIGLFVNTLALRVDLSEQPTVDELLHRVRDVTIEAYSHQELPFERLVEEMQPERSLSHQPLVQVVLALQGAVTVRADAPPAAAIERDRRPESPAPIPSTAKFDLTLALWESGSDLLGAVEFNTDLFDAATIARFAAALNQVLRGMAADPTRPVAALALVDDVERARILTDYNRTARAWDGEATVVERIWRQAHETPDATAVVVDGAGALTYRALIAGAEGIARRLRARGATREGLVPICFHRSTELLVAILGILRAGSGYVPLDPNDPAPRIEFMARDIGATVALAVPDLAGRLPRGIEVLPVSAAAVADDPRTENPLGYPSPGDVAYAIFTSGSTGRPKCAANEHGALLNRLLWMQEMFPLRAGDRVLQKTPYTFDVSVWELIWPLMVGATVVFARPGEHGDPAYLAEVIARQSITITHFVPSMLRRFLEHPRARHCTSLRWVIASGEALPADVVALFHSRLNAELHNLYGPTECAIDVTHWRCPRGTPPAVVPIGYPIANVRIHILDPQTREPLPAGATGELFIAGRGVGRGYVNRPELTAERFVPDPFAADARARMYRSGDLARYRADGSLEFLGRADHQLKVRGFRIEAGEVEEALRRHPAVAEAVVTVRSAGGSDDRLVAHCAPDAGVGGMVRSLLRYEGDGRLGDRIVEEMPNGLVVIANNRSETAFVYQEIFVDRAYLRAGLALPPDSVVLDVGGNVGMFALFVGMTCPGATVYSFEPIPEVFRLLSLNAGLYPWRIEPRQLGLGREPGTARFTYYPNVSILSGRYADVDEERAVILAYERNRGHDGPELEDVISARLRAESFECPIKTLSQVIADEGLERVDLLKVDVEKSEHDVLCGISDADWPKIRQVAVEVHEIDARLSEISDMLYRRGFEVTVDRAPLLSGSGVSTVFARRAGDVVASGAALRSAVPVSPARLRDQVRAAVAAQLPEYMVPSEIIWVERLPRLSSGKVDRKSLPATTSWGGPSTAGRAFVAPQSPCEVRIAQIWSDVLGCGRVGVHESFFDLGGHSLLATSAIARMRDAFGVEVSLRDFFADPTVAGLARCLDSSGARAPEAPDTIARAARGPDDTAPLSFSQERLWFLDRFSPGEASYNIPGVIPMFGVDPVLLERSLSEIVRRHEILRTAFPFVNGVPVQRVSADAAVRLRKVDVSAMDPAAVLDELRALAFKEAQRPFDLANGPLLRALLIRSAPEQYHLVLTIHHIATDGWSMSILYRELVVIYDAFGKGQPSPLPELPVQFADFATWQRGWLTGDVLDRQLDYWRGRLAGAPALLTLPTDHARPPVRSTRGDLHVFEIGPSVHGELSALAQRENATAFMALLAAFNVLLHRLCGVHDLCVGSPIANRRRPELEGLIGFFVNTIVLRTTWEGDPTFRQLLSTVREATLGAFAHQDMPFERLVAELEPERAMDRTPLFQVMLILQNLEGWDGTGLVESPPIATATAKFDLSLYLLPARAGLTGMLEYCVDLFTPESAACFASQYCELLAQIVKDPDAPISRLPLLTGPPPSTGPAPDRTRDVEGLTARVEAIAARTPDAPAVHCGSTTTTYAELVGKANGLAARLRAAGIQRGEVVAIALEPSVDLVVTLLAVRRVGGAYLVVDPADPPRRVAAVTGPQAKLLVVAGDGPAAPDGLEVFDVAGESGDSAASEDPVDERPGGGGRAALVPRWRPRGPVLREVDDESLAWRLRHAPLAAHVGRRIALATPPAADAAVLLLAGVYHGCCLILPERDPSVSTRLLSRALRSAAAEVLVATPKVLARLAREFAGSLEGVDVIVDLADPQQIERLRPALAPPLFGRCRWILGLDGFGSVSVRVTGRETVELDPPAGAVISVVTGDLDPAPLGAFGELVIEGAPEAAGECRGVRTGVRAVRGPSGEVKLRSNGELLRQSAADVEFALSAAGGAEAVVALDDDVDDLVAFVVRSPGVDESAIANDLASWLPPARIPATIRFTAELPLRPEGGVDVRALVRRAGHGVEHVAPQTELERAIALIWAEALGLDAVGRHDDFFRLGGHSLLATHVIAKLHVAFGVEIPLRTLFEHPTIEAFSRAVDELTKNGAGAPLPRLERVIDGGPAPLSFAQQRLWFLDRYEPGSAFYNVVGVLPLRGPIDAGALEWAVNAVVERHESLRLTFTMVDWEPVQIVAGHVHVAVPVIDLRPLAPEGRQAETARLTDETAKESFDLERGPLLRVRLIRLQDDEHVLLLSIHHIVADGWSMSILIRELGVHYVARAAGQRADLPELPIQFTDYARWQRAWLTGDVLARQIAFWRGMLAGAPPLLQLPSDRPRSPAQVFQGGLYNASLAPDLIAPLREFSRREGATTFMTSLAAFVALLGRYAGREDVVIGTPIANRRRPELAGLVGFIANTMALRVSLAGAVSFRELVARVRSVTLESYEYQDTPFEKLVEELQPDRDPSFNPLFQVMFAHQTTGERESAAADDGGASAEMAHTGAAKFDFTMFLMERPHDILGGVEYNAHLFTPETVGRFVEHYQRLLRGALRDPDRACADLDLVAADERRVVLAGAAPSMIEAPIHDAVAAVAGRHPEGIAVRTARTTLTYADLLARSDRCAAALRAAGVGPETPVGVYAHDPADEVVAMLGVLRAGATCVPVNRLDPVERIAARLGQAQAHTVVTTREVEGAFSAVTRVVAVDAPAEPRPAPPPAELGGPALIGEDGSGVSHEALAASVNAVAAEAALGAGESTLIAELRPAQILHDVLSVWISGGTAVLADVGELAESSALWRLADASGAVRAYVSPAIVRRLAEEVAASPLPPDLRELVVDYPAGLTSESSERLRDRLGHRALFERLVSPGAIVAIARWSWTSERPGGRPRPSLAVRILDPRGRPVAVGLPGAIHTVAGQSSVPLPFLGRWRDDGTVQVLGRSSARLSVRGYEIDGDLVESVLRAGPGVRDAVVACLDQELVAFVEGSGPEAAVRSAMNERLPAFVIPGTIVRVARLPRTASGEVDRGALSVPAATTPGDAARTGLEAAVAEAFSDALGREVGVRDEFLTLGGQCPEALRVTRRLSADLGVPIEPLAVFMHGSVERLTIALTERRLAESGDAERLLAELESIEDEEPEGVADGEAPRRRHA